MASQHPTESRYIVCQQGPRRLWGLVREQRLPDEQRGLGRLLDVGQRAGCKAYPILAGGARFRGEPLRRDQEAACTGTAMSDKRAPAICEAALTRDGFRVGILTSCNVTEP